MIRLALAVAVLATLVTPAAAQQWVASWTGSAHGPYPIGNPTAPQQREFGCLPDYDAIIMAPY